MSRYVRRYYEATYQGELCKKTAEQWYEITGRKPDTIRHSADKVLKGKVKYTPEMIVGLEEIEIFRVKPKTKKPHEKANTIEKEVFNLRAKFLRRRLCW